MAHRVLGNELQQRRIPEVVTAFEQDPLTDETRMVHQMDAQTIRIAIVKQVYRTAERRVFNPLVLRKVKTRAVGFLDMSSEPCPA